VTSPTGQKSRREAIAHLVERRRSVSLVNKLWRQRKLKRRSTVGDAPAKSGSSPEGHRRNELGGQCYQFYWLASQVGITRIFRLRTDPNLRTLVQGTTHFRGYARSSRNDASPWRLARELKARYVHSGPFSKHT